MPPIAYVSIGKKLTLHTLAIKRAYARAKLSNYTYLHGLTLEK
jgi:hypothetical protein